jgi:hypothetical protein
MKNATVYWILGIVVVAGIAAYLVYKKYIAPQTITPGPGLTGDQVAPQGGGGGGGGGGGWSPPPLSSYKTQVITGPAPNPGMATTVGTSSMIAGNTARDGGGPKTGYNSIGTTISTNTTRTQPIMNGANSYTSGINKIFS